MKRSKLYSVLTGTCPRCHEGKVFVHKNPYNIKKVMEMNNHCPKCGLSFKPEPGFYFGATYVSYSIGVAIVVTIAVAMAPFIPFFENFEVYAAIMIGTVTVLAPIIFRVSRHVWLNLFNKYREDAIEKHEALLKEESLH